MCRAVVPMNSLFPPWRGSSLVVRHSCMLGLLISVPMISGQWYRISYITLLLYSVCWPDIPGESQVKKGEDWKRDNKRKQCFIDSMTICNPFDVAIIEWIEWIEYLNTLFIATHIDIIIIVNRSNNDNNSYSWRLFCITINLIKIQKIFHLSYNTIFTSWEHLIKKNQQVRTDEKAFNLLFWLKSFVKNFVSLFPGNK